jgi:hypothetical protein
MDNYEIYNTLCSLLADEKGLSEKDYNSIKGRAASLELDPNQKQDYQVLFDSTYTVDGMVFLDEEKFVEHHMDAINSVFESHLGEKVIIKIS